MKVFLSILLAGYCLADSNMTTTQGGCGHDFDCSFLMDGWYPDVHNCRKYWSCTDHEASPHLCAENYLYDIENNWCDYPEFVSCGDRPICDNCDEHCEVQPTTPSTPSTSAQPTTADHLYCTEFCKADWGDFEIQCCSNVFCKCEAGIGYVYPCNPGLVFVESKDQCDYISNVPCCNS